MSQTMKANPAPVDWELDDGVRRLSPMPRSDGRVAVAAVSYTHLTLPTICSV